MLKMIDWKIIFLIFIYLFSFQLLLNRSVYWEHVCTKAEIKCDMYKKNML